MHTCTWAPTVFQGPQLVQANRGGPPPSGDQLRQFAAGYVQKLEALGISHLLIAQRWWGSGEEIEASSLDCLAMTTYFAAHSASIQLVTAIHPGFFHPTAIAKWGATMDALTGGRWSINVVSGWNLQEFDMYGVDALEHDTRYARSAEFIEVLRGAWRETKFSYAGDFYQTNDLQLEPRPSAPLEVFQGGQSPAALDMAGKHSDWMFLNGGEPEKLTGIIKQARERASQHNRTLRFAVYAAPLCRETDAQAWQEVDARVAKINPELAKKRRATVSGAEGMWAEDGDALSLLDTNEGYRTRLIGSPETILDRARELKAIGIDLLHLDLGDSLFVETVLPHIHDL